MNGWSRVAKQLRELVSSQAPAHPVDVGDGDEIPVVPAGKSCSAPAEPRRPRPDTQQQENRQHTGRAHVVLYIMFHPKKE